jgi:hypothetical protein
MSLAWGRSPVMLCRISFWNLSNRIARGMYMFSRRGDNLFGPEFLASNECSQESKSNDLFDVHDEFD